MSSCSRMFKRSVCVCGFLDCVLGSRCKMSRNSSYPASLLHTTFPSVLYLPSSAYTSHAFKQHASPACETVPSHPGFEYTLMCDGSGAACHPMLRSTLQYKNSSEGYGESTWLMRNAIMLTLYSIGRWYDIFQKWPSLIHGISTSSVSFLSFFKLLHSIPNEARKIKHDRPNAKYHIDPMESLYTSSTIDSFSLETMLRRDVAPTVARAFVSSPGMSPSSL